MAVYAGALVKDNVRLERELGRGAMGAVWSADQLALGTKVAVKVLLPSGFDRPDARARFEREAKRAASIDSPHVVKIFDYGVTPGGDPFIVMELLRGTDLERQLVTRGPLDLRSTASIVTQICRALDRAHACGVVHRDIKPANVFLLEGPGDPFVKLLDFGVAKAADGGHDLTATGAAIGTPYFMSPEQFMGAPDIDPRSDLWSVAALAYVCLTKAMPFVGPSVPAISVAAHSGSFQPPSRINRALPAAVDAWFNRAFRVDRGERFQSARELAESFDQAARSGGAIDPFGATTSAPPVAPVASQAPPYANTTTSPVLGPAAGHPAKQPGKSLPPVVLAGLGLVVLLVAGVGAASFALGARTAASNVADEESSSDERPKKKKKRAEAPREDTPTAQATAQPAAAPVQPAPAPSPTPESAPAASEKPEPAATPTSKPAATSGTKWRKRGMACMVSKQTGRCYKCCTAGDVLGPPPACECMFDGEAWDKGKR